MHTTAASSASAGRPVNVKHEPGDEAPGLAAVPDAPSVAVPLAPTSANIRRDQEREQDRLSSRPVNGNESHCMPPDIPLENHAPQAHTPPYDHSSTLNTDPNAAASEIKIERSNSPPIRGFPNASNNMVEASRVRRIDQSIRQIIDQGDLDTLDAGVAHSISVLEKLKHTFSQYVSVQADTWIQAIDKLISQANQKRTVIGVVGNTGAGKSSVINAIIDEERLVPTNCMRACTAVVTEISYNASVDPSFKYRAEVEFIGRADWEKDLRILMGDLVSQDGTVAKESSDPNSDAGIAWAKFHAVYPKKTKTSLPDCTVAGLMAESSLDVLGTTKKINEPTADGLYRQLQRFVDSKEKATGRIEYWPLVKVVKIYIKAPALSTGAVIVDLPGVHDSNAARSAVAQGYIKQCTGLWIVAPITRAVDDKAAKTLLGDSFKRQLKYDGGFSSITFICSKTDDISITEAADSLNLEGEIDVLDEQESKYKKEMDDIKAKMEHLRESQEVYDNSREEISDQIDAWSELKDRLAEGETVFAPPEKTNKRKRGGSDRKARKRHQPLADEDDTLEADDDFDGIEVDSDDDDGEGVQVPQEPLAMEDIKSKLDNLRNAKKNAMAESEALKLQIKQMRPQLLAFKSKIADIIAKKTRICVSGRNEYSKTAIQQDFAAGIKELDQENAAEEDGETFNPNEDLRNYDQVARSLPVFCVSSRAYQKMCGRLVKDANVPGFTTLEETEVPQLQAHCKKLTEAGRIQSSRSFLLNLCQQLTTFSLWALDDGTDLEMADEDKYKQVIYLEQRLKELDASLQEVMQSCMSVVRNVMSQQIFDKFPEMIREAVGEAPKTVELWGVPKREGGLSWSTYRAIVRRDGEYHSATAGHRNFNADLASPILRRLVVGWERSFQSHLPRAFSTYAKDCASTLLSFHDDVEERALRNGMGSDRLAMLKTQILTYKQLFHDLASVLVGNMTELQRDANRDFTPTIVSNMLAAYQACTCESGPGCFARMKEHMATHVDQNRRDMFDAATTTLTNHLNSMCDGLARVMQDGADQIFVKTKADYMGAIGGVKINTDTATARKERIMRSEVMTVLSGIDDQFQRIASGEAADGQAEQESDEHGAARRLATIRIKSEEDVDL